MTTGTREGEAIAIRPARREDVPALLAFADEASSGVWRLAWRRAARNGESDEAAGLRLLADPANDLSFANAWVAERAGEVLGTLIGWPGRPPADPAAAGPETHELDPVLAPYARLADGGSWFISELCVEAALRGAGLGTRFLGLAAAQARRAGRARVSLKAFEENEGAVRLYRRQGFTVADRAPVVRHPDIRFGGDLLLMVQAVPHEEAER